jgi:hypothetical protein
MDDARFLHLKHAVDKGLAEIREAESASVGEIVVMNKSELPIFAMDGEELKGAQQNRTLNLSIMFPPNQELTVPVSCVEQGRWGGGRRFGVEGRMHHAKGRARRVSAVSKSMKASGRARSNQSQVWDDISAKQSRMSTHSPTGDMSLLYERNQRTLTDYSRQFRYQEDMVGAIFSVEGLVGLELFDSAPTFEPLFHRILEAYAIEAVEEPNASKIDSAKTSQIIQNLSAAAWDQQSAAGMGYDWRSENRHFTASGLIVNKTCVHLSGYLGDRTFSL